MFHILGFLIFIVVIILIIGVAILSKVIKTFLGLGRKITGTDNRTTGSYSYASRTELNLKEIIPQAKNTANMTVRTVIILQRRMVSRKKYSITMKENILNLKK